MDRVKFLRSKNILVNDIEATIIEHLSVEQFNQYLMVISKTGRKASLFMFKLD